MTASPQRTGSRRAHLVLLAVAATVALTGSSCAANGSRGPGATTAPVGTPADTAALDPVETPCLSASPAFAALGTVPILGGSGPDAGQLSGLDWLITPDCERIVFGFLTDESAPASSIGLARLEFFPDEAILRVTMPRDVLVTAIADAVVEGNLIQRAFVVRSKSGELSVELVLDPEVPIEARGLRIGSPARLVVDVRPGEPHDGYGAAPPTIGRDVVVLSPAPGPADYPIRIRGYARTSADVVAASVSGQSGRVDRRITTAPSQDAWGEFAVTISEGPEGELTLTVEPEPSQPGAGAVVPLSTPAPR